MKTQTKKKKYDDQQRREGKYAGLAFRFSSSQRPPFSERRVIYPNGILPAPPILLLLHLRHLRDFRSPTIGCLFMGHHDNQGHLNTTDKARCCCCCCCCCFICTRATMCVKLWLWPHWPATYGVIGPKATRTRTRRGRRYYLFGRNSPDVDGQWLSLQTHQLRIIQG